MPAKSKGIELELPESTEDDLVYEVRGRDSSWKVWYPDEGGIATPIKVYDKDKNYKETIWVHGDRGKLTESFVEWGSAKLATGYARDLGAKKIRLVKIKERKKKTEEPVL